MEGVLFEIVILVVAAFLGGFAARAAKFPPVVGYIVAGIIFGVIGRGYISSYENLHVISEIGISLLLFTLGFEFSFEKLRKLNKNVLFAGVFQILLTVVVIFPILMLFKLSLPVAILFSIILSFSSTAVVVKVLEEKGALSTFPGSNVFVFLLIKDLMLVPVLFVLPLLFGDGLGVGNLWSVIFSAGRAFVVFTAVLVASKLFLSRVLNLLFRYPTYELVLLATIFIVFSSIGIFTLIGIPQTLAAFLAGILISEHGKNMSPLDTIRPFRDVLLVLFFVLIGMLLDIEILLSILPLVIFLSILVFIAKFMSIFLVLRSNSYLLFPAVFISSYMANIGEFSIVIGQISYDKGYIGEVSYNLLLALFIVSLLIFPFVVKYADVVFEYIIERGWMSVKGKNELYVHRVASETNTLKNHAVICGHGRVGREVTHLLDDASIPYVVVDFDRKIYNDLVGKNKSAVLGDPSDFDVLKAAGVERAKALVVAVPESVSQKKIIKIALRENPKIVIVCRSHEEKNRYDLLNLGANTIVIPEFEAGIRIGHAILDVFGVKRDKIMTYVKRLRRQHFID